MCICLIPKNSATVKQNNLLNIAHMSELENSYFLEDAEEDIKNFTAVSSNSSQKRVLIFPPFNNYRRFLIHQIVSDHYSNKLKTFSIGQGEARRLVICYISEYKGGTESTNKIVNLHENNSKKILMSANNALFECSNSEKKSVKAVPSVELYRPPAARQPGLDNVRNPEASESDKCVRQKRPDRAVYVPKHRRCLKAAQNTFEENKIIKSDVANLKTDCFFNTNKSKDESVANNEFACAKDEFHSSISNDQDEYLSENLLKELSDAVGEVIIEKPKNNYKSLRESVDLSYNDLAHVIEMYDFPSSYKTSDIVEAFNGFKTTGFELRWVNDTHCLGIFSSSVIAEQVLSIDHPVIKTRPLKEATDLSKQKAIKCAEFLQPYKSRPETCAALARRLVTGALGVKLATAKEEREQEKIVLHEAKERKKLLGKKQ